jgi:hypothetical protein
MFADLVVTCLYTYIYISTYNVYNMHHLLAVYNNACNFLLLSMHCNLYIKHYPAHTISVLLLHLLCYSMTNKNYNKLFCCLSIYCSLINNNINLSFYAHLRMSKQANCAVHLLYTDTYCHCS